MKERVSFLNLQCCVLRVVQMTRQMGGVRCGVDGEGRSERPCALKQGMIASV